jgi:hypothetical protein
VIVRYRDYIDELIAAENRVLYVVVMSLYRRFTVLKQLLSPKFSQELNFQLTYTEVNLGSSRLDFVEFAYIVATAMRQYELYVYQLNLVKYIQNLLSQTYFFELSNSYQLISSAFSSVDFCSGNAVSSNPNVLVLYPDLLINPVLVVLYHDFYHAKFENYNFLSHWLANLPLADFTETI